jgi:hypothetical protein
LKVSYTEEAVADIVSALTYLAERSPAAAANLDADSAALIAWLLRSSMDPFRGSGRGPKYEAGQCRRFESTTSASRPSC